MKLLIAAALFTLGLAAPVTESKSHNIATRAPFSCPGGLTNSSPMCCSVNVLGVLALDCQNGTGLLFFNICSFHVTGNNKSWWLTFPSFYSWLGRLLWRLEAQLLHSWIGMLIYT